MRYEEWEPIYLEILRDLGYRMEDDVHAAEVLLETLHSALVEPASEGEVGEIISEEDSVIIGPCVTSEAIAQRARAADGLRGRLVVTVGEGTKNCLVSGIAPQLVFTDLDGFPEFDLMASESGAVTFIHAHGDNIPELKTWSYRFLGKIVPTCQCRPPRGAHNWGGFTDGDRAYCTLKHFRARSISLWGFDFANPCGTKEMDWEDKRRKLQWAQRIIRSQFPSGPPS